MNYLLYAFGIVWAGLGLYTIHLLLTRSRLSRTRGNRSTHG
ncbi:MAG: CcmD family protein [Methanosarcinales archaeon]|nr:CcmD family protein [Methanosarcinales archaeon]